MSENGWEFDYAPLHFYARGPAEAESDFVVATEHDTDPATIVQVLGTLAAKVATTPLLSVHPLFWYRVELGEPVLASEIERALLGAAVPLRYVMSARRGGHQLAPPANFSAARPRRARDWKVRPARSVLATKTPGRWFLEEKGVRVNRAICGTGTGTRLAVIDNDALEIDQLDLDAEVLVGVSSVPRSGSHGALMVGWAVGAMPSGGDAGLRFHGVAPDASPRLYCIPKNTEHVFDLPVAIVRAVDDGADVVMCATYLEGLTSPLLDDALEFARRLGRFGRGTPVVFPASREMSSAPGSSHASLSLGMCEPAADPRVFCVGPSARDGGWFLWRDRKGKLRPFSNRGPSVRWLAPGDDMAYPFSERERPAHAESSGAAAIASGVILLVLAQNRELSVSELDRVLTLTASPVAPTDKVTHSELADLRDLQPSAIDRDGHNAKHGYGRLDAAMACAVVRDPFGAALILMGDTAAAAHREGARSSGELAEHYSTDFAQWAVRVLLQDETVRHATVAIARAFRLLSGHPSRAARQAPGALARQLLIVLRCCLSSRAVEPTREVADELRRLEHQLRDAVGRAPALVDEQILRWVELAAGPSWARPGSLGTRWRAEEARSASPVV